MIKRANNGFNLYFEFNAFNMVIKIYFEDIMRDREKHSDCFSWTFPVTEQNFSPIGQKMAELWPKNVCSCTYYIME